MAQFETRVVAAPEVIAGLVDRILAFLEENAVDGRTANHTALIVDELLTNLGTHGDHRDSPVTVVIAVEPTEVRGQIIDTAEPFDPTVAPEPDLDAALEDRPIGGLGLHLARELSSVLEYIPGDGENRTRFAVARA